MKSPEPVPKNRLEDVDPRTVIFILLVPGVTPLFLPSWQVILASLGGLLLFAVLTRISGRRLLVPTRRVFWFLFFIVAINTFSGKGRVLFGFAGLYATDGGVFQGIELSAKLLALSWSSFLLVLSLPAARIVEAFETWLHPFRKRLGPIVMLLTVTFSMVPALVLITRQIRMNYRARGIDVDSGVVSRVKFLSTAALPLVAASSRSAHHLAIAMESRNYHPSASRSSFLNLRFRTIDRVLILVALLFLLFTSLLSL